MSLYTCKKEYIQRKGFPDTNIKIKSNINLSISTVLIIAWVKYILLRLVATLHSPRPSNRAEYQYNIT